MLIGIILAILRDQLRIPLEAYRQRRLIDSQSSAFNRQHFETMLNEQTEKSAEQDSIYSVVMIKLNGLSDYYDTLPQQVLNRLLSDVVGVLRAGLRGNDSVGRWDDFTFSLLLPDTPMKAAETIKGRLLKALTPAMPLASLDEKITLDPFIGAAAFNKDDTSDTVTLRAIKSMSDKSE